MISRFFASLTLASLVSLVGVSARAEMLASLGTSVMFESSSNGRTLDQRQPWALRGGYRFERFDVYAEYARFGNATTGTSYVGVTRKQEQLLLWGRHVVRQFRLMPYAAVGVGALAETIETRLGTEERTDSGRPEAAFAGAVGAIAPITQWCEVSLEGRAETSPAYAPHPVFGLSVFASAKF